MMTNRGGVGVVMVFLGPLFSAVLICSRKLFQLADRGVVFVHWAVARATATSWSAAGYCWAFTASSSNFPACCPSTFRYRVVAFDDHALEIAFSLHRQGIEEVIAGHFVDERAESHRAALGDRHIAGEPYIA